MDKKNQWNVKGFSLTLFTPTTINVRLQSGRKKNNLEKSITNY